MIIILVLLLVNIANPGLIFCRDALIVFFEMTRACYFDHVKTMGV